MALAIVAGCRPGPSREVTLTVPEGMHENEQAQRWQVQRVPLPTEIPMQDLSAARWDVRPYQDWPTRENVARSLARIGSEAVPALREALHDPHPQVRHQAADVLARIGPAAEAAVPDLVAALEDQDERVRKAAIYALGQIGPGSSPAVPDLMQILVQQALDDSPAAPAGAPFSADSPGAVRARPMER